MAGKNDFVSDRRLYLDAEDNVVEAKDPKAVKLLVGEGGTLSAEQAEKYGLTSAAEDGADAAEGELVAAKPKPGRSAAAGKAKTPARKK